MSGRADQSDSPDGDLDSATEGSGDRPVVLVVDDEQTLADLYANHLAEEYQVRTAYGGEAALEALDGTVDVMLLDRRMPGLSGDEVLEALAEQGYDGGVVMLTAVSPDTDVVGMDFDEYLVKPITLPELTETVSRIVTLKSDEAGPRRLYALLSKKYTLEARMAAADLREDDRYLGLLDEIESLRERLDPSAANRIEAKASAGAFGALDGETSSGSDVDGFEPTTEAGAGGGSAPSPNRPLADPAAGKLFDHLRDAIFVVDGDREIVDCNEAFTALFGYDRSAVIGERASTLYVGRAAGGGGGDGAGSGDAIEYRTADGSTFTGRTVAVPLRADGASKAVVVSVTDGAAVDRSDRSAEIEVAASLLRHEVGNDLNGLAAELGRLRAEVPSQHRETIDDLEDRVSRAGTSLEEFSEYLRTAADGTLPETTAVELAPVVEAAIDRVEADADVATFEVGDLDPVTVRADDRLDVVVRNLLQNAVTHHDGEPTVHVDSEVEAETVRLRVADDGPGIPAEVRSALTDPGRRDAASDGLGLGLYLVDQLVASYGGSVAFEDREPRGTVVVVELPRAT